MSSPAPLPLPENRDLAFVGETVRPAALIPAAVAWRFLVTRNTAGRDNAEVVREVVSTSTAGALRRHWVIDFPPGLSEAEAALYELPSAHLRHALRDAPDHWWTNPHAQPAHRALITRRERVLVAARCGPPDFAWISSELLPDDTLLVVARDDDFTHGVLRSRAFAVWWRAFARDDAPEAAIASFPFPWAPTRLLSSLTRTEEEARHALAAAARSADAATVDAAVATAYGWPSLPEDDAELLALLRAKHAARLAAG